jgi:hypothetical protein
MMMLVPKIQTTTHLVDSAMNITITGIHCNLDRGIKKSTLAQDDVRFVCGKYIHEEMRYRIYSPLYHIHVYKELHFSSISCRYCGTIHPKWWSYSSASIEMAHEKDATSTFPNSYRVFKSLPNTKVTKWASRNLSIQVYKHVHIGHVFV